MILTAENLQKRFKDKEVLHDINFQVREGEVHAILGRNGAGKSTFIKIALGLLYPSSGNITVYGEKPGIHNAKVGYLSENITLYPHLSAKDNLKVTAYSANQKLTDDKISAILDKINLNDAGNKPAKSFSLGMKRRLQLAMATMIKKVDFLILDEPTNGLDINGLLWLKEYINELRESGVSILLASHAILDLQECITNYVIFHNGTIARKGNWLEEQKKATGIQITVDSRELKKTIDAICNDGTAVSDDERQHIYWQTDRNYKEACEFLYKKDIFPENVCEMKGSLESIFLDTVKEPER